MVIEYNKKKNFSRKLAKVKRWITFRGQFFLTVRKQESSQYFEVKAWREVDALLENQNKKYQRPTVCIKFFSKPAMVNIIIQSIEINTFWEFY